MGKLTKAVVVTDIHEHGDYVNEIVAQEYPALMLSCGDDEGYYEPPVPCYFVHGNHEDFNLIGTMKNHPGYVHHKHLRLILPQTTTEIQHGDSFLTLSGLGGIYHHDKYDRHVDPRYFTKQEVLDLRLQQEGLDVLLFHETLPAFGITRKGKRMGAAPLEKTIKTLRPKIVFCGHHDHIGEITLGKSVCVQLADPRKSYVVLSIGPYGVESYQLKHSFNEPLTEEKKLI